MKVSSEKDRINLKERTKELHHAAEKHPLGQSMADGSMPPRWWADWLGALFIIHSAIDRWMPEALQRVVQIAADVAETQIHPRTNFAALDYARSLDTREKAEGAAYVFTGAHLMGGEITKRNVQDRLPVHHLEWTDRQSVVQTWKPLRERDDLEEHALAAFQAVIDVMDEITNYDE